MFSKGRAEKTLEKSPYIASAKISAKLPHTMRITIKERKARGYVPYMGSYLYIDEEGRVLEVAGICRDALPLVKGLKFDSFTEGGNPSRAEYGCACGDSGNFAADGKI